MPPFDQNRSLDERLLEMEVSVYTLVTLLNNKNVWDLEEYRNEYKKWIQVATIRRPDVQAFLIEIDPK